MYRFESHPLRHRARFSDDERRAFPMMEKGGSPAKGVDNYTRSLLDGVYTSYATTYSQSIIQASVTAPMKPAVVLA